MQEFVGVLHKETGRLNAGDFRLYATPKEGGQNDLIIFVVQG